MISAFGIAALWGVLSLGGPWPFPAASTPDPLIGPDHVPFVGQTPLLCGGAAASMLLRFWGERHVYGDDFQGLVRPEEGGIATTDLVAAVGRRGYETRVAMGRPEAALATLAEGIPSMLLLEGDPTLHYVVLVRADSAHVWVHDPNFGPERRMTRAKLMERWEDSDFWMLVVTPSRRAEPRPADPPPRRLDDPGTEGPEVESHRETEASMASLDAMNALRAGDHARARSLARAVLDDTDGRNRIARRILATSYYLERRATEALEQWNALDEPKLDLLEIRGAEHTRYHALARRSGLNAGELVTPAALSLARRRIADVPGVRRARLDYTALPDGSADVRAFVDEYGRWPGWRDAASTVLGGLTDGAATLEAGPFISAGDRWTLRGRWRDAQSLWSVAVSTTSDRLPGIVSLQVDWRRERYPEPSPVDRTRTLERTRRSLALREWLAPSLGLEVGLALESWPSEGRRYSAALGVTWALPTDALRLDVEAEHWRAGPEPYTRVSLAMRARRDLGSAVAVHFAGGAAGVSDAAPRLVWPGAGIGEVRGPLLRGYPLATGGVIAGPAFGRELLHGSAEIRLFKRFGPVRYGVAGFVDGARAWKTDSTPTATAMVGPGAGVFLDAGDQELRVDFARGEASWTLSAGVRARH